MDRLIKKFDQLGQVDVMPVIRKSARRVQNTAIDLSPVDTGFLRESIKVKHYPKEKSSVVYTTTEYAPYVEFGTSKSKPQPFLSPALDQNRKQIESDIKELIKKKAK